MRILLFLSFCALAGAGCQSASDSLDDLLHAAAPPEQHFTLRTGRDTVITCAGGTVLRFCASTLQTAAPEVVLAVREVFTRADMIAARLVTQSIEGYPLESGGMLYVAALEPAGVTIDPGCPIRVSMPARLPTESMRLFDGRTAEMPVRWENPKRLTLNAAGDELALGQSIFCNQCAACHSEDLTQNLTGPPLANVHRVRDTAWLWAFTRGSQRMIADGDSLALNLWACWKPNIMQDFPLTDAELRALYRFIAAESAAQGVPDSVFYDPCHAGEEPMETLLYFTHVRDTTLDGAVMPVRPEDVERFKNEGRLSDVAMFEFPLDRFGWYNCDRYLENAIEMGLYVSVVDRQRYDAVRLYLVYDHRNAVFDFSEYQPNGFGLRGDFTALVPPEPGRIVAIAMRKGKLYRGVLALQVGSKNPLEIGMERSTTPDLRRELRETVEYKPVFNICPRFGEQ